MIDGVHCYLEAISRVCKAYHDCPSSLSETISKHIKKEKIMKIF